MGRAGGGVGAEDATVEDVDTQWRGREDCLCASRVPGGCGGNGDSSAGRRGSKDKVAAELLGAL